MARTSRILRTIAPAVGFAAAAVLCGAAPAAARDSLLEPALVTSSGEPAPPEIEAFYRQRGNEPIWLRSPAAFEAAKRLPTILRRAPLDGLADGPELARKVSNAIARAQKPGFGVGHAEHLAEDKMLSAAWVQYVRALKTPVAGIVYGDLMLTPLVPEPERILFQAATAPSLAAHVEAVAAVNPIYARLREAADNRLASRRSKDRRRGGDRALEARIIANLERARALPSSGRYIIVDAATATLSMYEDGEARDTMKVIVGKPDTPTPQIASLIHYVTLNPYWNIPKDVARSNVAPFVVKYGTTVLREMRYELVSDWSERAMVLDPSTIDWNAVVAGKTDVHLRQQPGPGNMMGAVKFGFANEFGVYLHDTPKKELFAQARRNLSLGCVRVEDAKRLARWILGSEPVATTDEPEQYVQLAQPVPIYITYLTARAEGGRLAFVDDVYGRDSGRPKTGPKLAEVELATASPSNPVPTPH